MLKFKLTPVVTAICLMGGLSSQAFAADATSEQLIKKINARTAQLESEVKKLRTQLVNLKKEEKAKNLKQDIETKKLASQVKNQPKTFLELGATPVISSPYVGVRSQYDASDLIVNIPTYDQDYQLLKQQQRLQNEFKRQGLKAPTTALIELSGKIEGQVLGTRGYTGNRTTDVDLSGTELDVTGHFTPWLTGFMAFGYDNNPPGTGANTVTRTDNSRVTLKKAWMTLGNLNKSPFYATIGQRYHFGQYSSFMVSTTLTQLLTRIKARSVLVGYHHPGSNGLYSTVYSFKGDSNVGTSHINQIGATLGYQYSNKTFKTDVGVDYVNNVADAEGMQSTGSPYFAGFGASSTFESLVKRVPGAAIHGKLGVGPVALVAEYTGATERFNSANLSFNGKGAKPQAFNVEGAYMFKVMNKPANIALGYAQTKDALALNLPQRRLVTAFNISPWKDTLASLEFRRDSNYAATDVATGQTSAVLVPTGRFSNAVTAQFGVYF